MHVERVAAVTMVLGAVAFSREAAAQEGAFSTPHPALVIGVAEDVFAGGLLAGGLYFTAGGDLTTGPGLLIGGLAVAAEGIASTAHGISDRRALRCASCAAVGNGFVSLGTATGAVSIAFLVHGRGYEAVGGIVAIPAVVFLGIGIPLFVHGELDAEPGAKPTAQRAVRVRVSAGLGQLGLSGAF